MVKKTTKKKTTKKTSTSAVAKKTKTTKKTPVKKTPKLVKEEEPKKTEHSLKDSSDLYLHLKISRSLKDKLIIKAKSEGVSLEDFAGELLAEGLVLRAWEIMERKTAMSKSSGNNNSHNNNNNNNKNRYNNNRHKRNNNNNNNRRFNNNNSGNFNGNTMDDKANFMEYLRNQEVQQR